MAKLLAQVDLGKTLFGTHPIAQTEAAESPTSFISAILPNVFVFAGLILLIYLVAGGFMYISAAGNPDQAKNGQQAITNAIIGFLVIFASYWVIQIIEVVTGVSILKGW